MSDGVARMGEWVVASPKAGGVLTCIGLGSCIGLALLDRRSSIAGLAHVMLPESPAGGTSTPGKFADLAVPALLADLEGLGISRIRLEAVLVGGAQMFAFGASTGRDIGKRNEAAVREQLTKLRIPVKAHATGGERGRSMKVDPVTGEVTCREAAGQNQVLLAGIGGALSLAAA